MQVMWYCICVRMSIMSLYVCESCECFVNMYVWCYNYVRKLVCFKLEVM